MQNAIQQIKQAGPENTKITPTENNLVKIQIKTPTGWVTIANNLKQNLAEDMIRQSTNRLLLG